MHQQVRTSTTKSGSGSPGPGAMADEGGIVDILQILVDAGVNLQAAGGATSIAAGSFVFSVHHEGEDDGPGEEAAALLQEHGYRGAHAVHVHECSVADEPGGLLGCIQEIERTDGEVYEIFVGTPDRRGRHHGPDHDSQGRRGRRIRLLILDGVVEQAQPACRHRRLDAVRDARACRGCG